MKDDTQKALEELQEQLLSDDTVTDDDLSDDALLEDIINEVHAEQQADLRETDEQPVETAPQAHAPAPVPGKIAKAKRNEDFVQTVLMFVASGLSLGVSCLLIYWLVNYL